MLRHFGQQVLRSLFRVQEGEGVLVGVMLLFSLAAVGGVIITGQLVSRALFLSSLPESAIPYKFILPPLVLLATSAAYARVAGHLRRDRLILLTYGLMALGMLAFRLLLEAEYGRSFAALCALYVFFDVVGDLVILQFWTFAGDLFDARQARRLFGLIAGGSTLANVLFGAALSAAARQVAPENLVFATALSLVVCMLCAGFLGGRQREALEAAHQEGGARPTAKGSLADDLRDVLSSPLLVSMCGIIALVALASSIADYQLDRALRATYGEDGQGMVFFLGQFRLWAGVGAALLQFFLAGRLLERFGVAAALLLLPAAIGLGSGAILLTGGLLWAAAVPRGGDVVLKYTIHDAAFNLLYLPVDGRQRAKAKAILDGVVKPPMITVLGLVFLWVGPRFGVVEWAWPMLAVVALWLFLVGRVSRQYVQALSRSIRMRRLDGEHIDLADESSLRVVRQTLRAEDPLQVMHALSLLPRIDSVDWAPQVVPLLEHPHPQVRVLTLDFLAERQAVLYAEQVHQCLHDSQEQVRAAAIRTLCALGRLQAIEQVLPFLEDASPRIRAAAVLGLVRHAGLDGMLHAGEHLKALLSSPEPQARLEGVRILEALQVRSFYHPLIERLEDESDEVQIAALRAAARIRAPELVPHLLPRLDHPLLGWYATEALAGCAGADLSVVGEVLADPGQAQGTRHQLVHVLRKERSAGAARLLAGRLEDGDERLRGLVYEACVELRTGGVDVPLERERLRAALDRELRRAYELHLLRCDLDGPAGDVLLVEAVQMRIVQTHERVVALLDLLYEEVEMEWMCDALGHRDARLRATVLELVDNVVEREINELLQPLLGTSEGERLAVARRRLGLEGRSRRTRLDELAIDADTWLRACALHAIGASGEESLLHRVEQGLEAEARLVRETALVAWERLQGRERLLALLATGDAARFPEALVRTYQRGEPVMALSTLEKVFFLKSAPLFEHMPGEEIVGMVSILHQVDIPRGETFIRRGEEGDCLYILVDGEVEARMSTGERRVMGAREVFGERSVLSEQPRSADCVALTDVVALRIDKKDFWKMMNEQPKLTVEVLRVVVDRYLD